MAKKPKQAVILAGGFGTRLRPITNTIPKPMIIFHGKPFLEYLIQMLVDQGFQKVVLLLGYLPDKIKDYFGDGQKFGIEIKYFVSDVEDDTGLRLQKAKDLFEPIFLLMYCDNYWPLNFDKLWEKYLLFSVEALVTVYTNKDNYTKSNIRVDKDGFIEIYDKTRLAENLQGVDIGFFILKKKIIDLIPKGNNNFEKSVFPYLIKNREIITYQTDHRYYSVGSHEKLKLTEKFLERKPTIVLDRDGVINKKAPKAKYIKNWGEWEWLPGSKEAISRLKIAGYQIVIVSNQAGIARGYMTHKELSDIHRKMISELELVQGSIDKIYFCPHNWEDNCDCRKPKPGMLFQAQRDLNLDLSRIYFVGDDERDEIAGKIAGMKTILVSDRYSLLDFVLDKILV